MREPGFDFRDYMIERRFERVGRAILVASGKGGVGKSTIAAAMAALMARAGMSVGLLDADVHGPSSALIFKVREMPREAERGLLPPISNGVKVMSIDLFAAGRPIPVAGRAARELLKEVLALTDWGELDYLIVDMPPGTGDVMMALAKVRRGSSIVVTAPSALSASVVRRVVELLMRARVPIIGILENFSYMAGSDERPLGRGGGRALASEFGIKFLGELPMDPKVPEAVDSGDVQALLRTEFAGALLNVMKGAGLLEPPRSPPR